MVEEWRRFLQLQYGPLDLEIVQASRVQPAAELRDRNLSTVLLRNHQDRKQDTFLADQAEAGDTFTKTALRFQSVVLVLEDTTISETVGGSADKIKKLASFRQYTTGETDVTDQRG